MSDTPPTKLYTALLSEIPDDRPTTAKGYMYEEGCHNEVVDLALGLLVKQGMTIDEAEAALERECSEWLRDQQDEWWM